MALYDKEEIKKTAIEAKGQQNRDLMGCLVYRY